MGVPSKSVKIEQKIDENIPKSEIVTALCVSKGEVLFVKSQKDGRDWELPTGRVESNEEPVDAVKREFREETGLEAENPTLIRIFELSFPDGSTVKQYVFNINLERVKPPTPGGDAVEAAFYESAPEEVSFGKKGRDMTQQIISEV